MATAATVATTAAPTQLTKQLQLLALVLALALVSVLAMHASTLASAAKEWAAPTLHAASTCACIFNLAAALLAWRKPTPALGATAACRDLPQQIQEHTFHRPQRVALRLVPSYSAYRAQSTMSMHCIKYCYHWYIPSFNMRTASSTATIGTSQVSTCTPTSPLKRKLTASNGNNGDQLSLKAPTGCRLSNVECRV